MNKYYLGQAAKLISPLLYYSQVHRLTKPFYSGIGHILMLHRVVPERGKLRIHNHKSLEITPQHLEELIVFFKNDGYRFLALDDVLAMDTPEQWNRKFIVFTFDDGYCDNYQYAYPIFKKHNVPFTIYVATSLPDATAFLWWYMLEDLVVNQTQLSFSAPDGRKIFTTESVKQKELVYNVIRNILAHADAAALKTYTDELFDNPDAESLRTYTKSMSLSWNQVKELGNDSLVTIGSHTVNHLPLNSLSVKDSQYEIQESKRLIEFHIGKEVRHFCYPLGSYGAKEIDLLAKSGYRSATTIKMANVFAENLNHPFCLPRIMINSLTDRKLLRLQLNGLLPAVRNKFKRIIL